MFVEEIRRAVLATPRERLADIQAALWKSHAAGAIGDDDAQGLAELIQARKAIAGPAVTARRHVGSRPVSSASIARRRRTASAGWMPPHLASQFTLSEAAALSVVAAEVARCGRCELAVGEIAARAGTCATIVKNAVRHARRLGLVAIEMRRVRRNRNLPNVVTIISPEWVTWLRIGAKKQSEGGAVRFAPTTRHHLIPYPKKTARHLDWGKREIERWSYKVQANQ